MDDLERKEKNETGKKREHRAICEIKDRMDNEGLLLS